MKIFKLTVFASLLMILTAGCDISTDSPEELIKERPIYNEENKILYENISSLFPEGSSLILPKNSSEVGKINKIDLDSDGIYEYIAFEKRESAGEEKNKVGFVIFNKEDNAVLKAEKNNQLIDGDSIEYANFYDLNNDGYKEIIISVKADNKTNMYIYSYKESESINPIKLNPTWILDRNNLNDFKIDIGDINNDLKPDIITAHHDTNKNILYISVVNFDGQIQLIDFVKFENVRNSGNLDNLYVNIETVSTIKEKDKTIEQKGIVLDISLVENSNYITQIIYMDNNKLKKAFKDDDKNIVKSYYIPIEDINNDKVVDIPIINDGSGNMYTQKTSANISWYRWNGKLDEDSSLLFTTKIYYNYKYNYKMLIPNNLAKDIHIEEEYLGSEVLFKFYYYDKVQAERKNLFTIAVTEKNVIEEKDSKSKMASTILAETSDKRYLLYQNDIELLQKFKIDQNALKEYFSLIY